MALLKSGSLSKKPGTNPRTSQTLPAVLSVKGLKPLDLDQKTIVPVKATDEERLAFCNEEHKNHGDVTRRMHQNSRFAVAVLKHTFDALLDKRLYLHGTLEMANVITILTSPLFIRDVRDEDITDNILNDANLRLASAAVANLSITDTRYKALYEMRSHLLFAGLMMYARSVAMGSTKFMVGDFFSVVNRFSVTSPLDQKSATDAYNALMNAYFGFPDAKQQTTDNAVMVCFMACPSTILPNECFANHFTSEQVCLQYLTTINGMVKHIAPSAFKDETNKPARQLLEKALFILELQIAANPAFTMKENVKDLFSALLESGLSLSVPLKTLLLKTLPQRDAEDGRSKAEQKTNAQFSSALAASTTSLTTPTNALAASTMAIAGDAPNPTTPTAALH